MQRAAWRRPLPLPRTSHALPARPTTPDAARPLRAPQGANHVLLVPPSGYSDLNVKVEWGAGTSVMDHLPSASSASASSTSAAKKVSPKLGPSRARAVGSGMLSSVMLLLTMLRQQQRCAAALRPGRASDATLAGRAAGTAPGCPAPSKPLMTSALSSSLPARRRSRTATRCWRAPAAASGAACLAEQATPGARRGTRRGTRQPGRCPK